MKDDTEPKVDAVEVSGKVNFEVQLRFKRSKPNAQTREQVERDQLTARVQKIPRLQWGP